MPAEHIKRLIRGCIKNDRESQKELYKQLYSYSMGICVRYAENREEASEIMNDGFMKVFRYIPKFDIRRPILPWIRAIMVNSSIDHFKKNRKYLADVGLHEAENRTSTSSTIESISYDEILELIKKLPDAYRTVFNLIAIEGFTHKEVSERLGISEGTSKSNYSRAKKKLQEHLSVYFEVN